MNQNQKEQGRTAQELTQFISSIQLSPLATLVTDCSLPDNPIIAVNEAFVDLTGYAVDEVLGRNCRLLSGPATEPENRARLRKAIAEGHQLTIEITNYRKDGSRFCNALMIAPMLDEHGKPAYFIGSQMAVRSSELMDDHRQQEAKTKIARLTKRQKQVLALMAGGYRNRDIADKLAISEKTVKLHRALALRSLEAQTSGDAIRIAVEAGFVGLRTATE